MEIKRYNEMDASKFLSICRKAFTKHNVFDRSIEEVKSYLKKKDVDNSDLGGVFFAYENGKLVGGCVLKIEEKDIPQRHIRFKYNHVVGKTEKVKLEILRFLDDKVRRHIREGRIKTAKIEAGLAENELDLEFYKKNGFKIEGELSSHYRYGEKVYLLGKEITG